MDKKALTARLKSHARYLGFQLTGVCPAVRPPGWSRFNEWLEAGYAGEMRYLADRQAAYAHPRHVMDGTRSLLLLGMNYATQSARVATAGQGRISRYAWGPGDYHDLVHARLKQLAAAFREWSPHARLRGVIDTAPLLEREFAQLAGLGWVGKNTMLINKHAGSWFFLAAMLTDVELAYDAPHDSDHCGTCRACLDACPTNAFPRPYQLDASRCISYLTIELRGPIPELLRPGTSNWVFGCDICQEVCPWNRRAPRSEEPDFEPRADANPIELAPLFALDDDAFRSRFRRTPLWRTKRRGLLRNAAIALGNHRHPSALPALELGLADAEPLVRGASAWALGNIAVARGRRQLHASLERETDPHAGHEMQRALAKLDGAQTG